MNRVGSRVDPLLVALHAGHAAGAFDLPASMITGRARLSSLQQVVAAQQPPLAEQTARTAAVRSLLDDPASDVVAAVLDARAADDEHRLRADLLGEAGDLAADTADVLPDGWGTLLLDAHAACVTRLRTAYATFSPTSVDPDDLWGASPQVRGAWTSFTRGAAHYESIMTVHHLVRASSPAALDHENLFFEIRNMDACWPERITGLRPISTLREPWPPRRDVLPWLLWVHQAGGILHMPSAAQQDLEWDRVFGERAREFALGDRHVGQMREIFAG